MKRSIFAGGKNSIHENYRFDIKKNYNLLIRLTAPSEGDSWLIEMLMQSATDPRLIIPVEKTSGLSRALAIQQFNAAKKLSPCLSEQTNGYANKINPKAAHVFLTKDAAQLRAAGFKVQIPTGLVPWTTPNIILHLSRKTIAGQSSRLNPLAFDYQVAIGDTTLSYDEFLLISRAKIPLVKVKDRWVEFNQSDAEKIIGIMNKRGRGDFLDIAALSLEAAIEGIETYAKQSTARTSITYASIADAMANELQGEDAPINGSLREYQRKGLAWLSQLKLVDCGALLADDMGLGKTIQVIALLAKEKTKHPSLIICPTSVLTNWAQECSRFCPQLRVSIHHGAERGNAAQFKKMAQEQDIVITSYALAWRDYTCFSSLKWDNIILDEAQNIKNPFTKQSRHVKKLQGRFKIALTGTPIENRLSDLWSIMDFINPGFFPNLDIFIKKLAKPIETKKDTETAALLRTAVGPFMLRRLKNDKSIITELPDKIESVEWCSLTDEQATLYQAVVDDTVQKLKDAPRQRMAVLAAITKLKQICNHPSNFLKDSKTLEQRSGKIERLLELIEMILEREESCLIFSQYTEMTGLLHEHLKKRWKTPIFHYHGSLQRKERDSILREFHKDATPKILIMSLKAGGTGLNLIGANNIIHFDRWWNPAVENQASDRSHRIGQKKTVFVYKLVTKGTIEERIEDIINHKRHLAQSIIDKSITDMTPEKLKEFLALT